MSFGLPAIDTIKDLLTGSSTEKLKDFIEPFALVNAGIFLTLNLALVYPLLDPFRGPQLISTIFGLSGAWLAVLGTLTLLLLSYVINNLNGFSLELMSGESFRKTPFLSDWLLAWQTRKFRALATSLGGSKPAAANSQARKEHRNQLAYRLAYDFPASEAELGLTGLGNRILSPTSYVSHQYGASTEIVWPILHESLGDDNKLIKTVQQNWNSLQFFASLATLLVILAVEAFFVGLYGGKFFSRSLWVSLGAIFLGYLLTYYLASQKALQWGSALRRVFDSNLDKALEQLGMEQLQALNPSDPELKEAWKKVSSWLAYGASHKVDAPSAAWYKEQKPPKWPQCTHPDYLSVDSHTQDELMATTPAGQTGYECHEVRRYRFAIYNAKVSEDPSIGRGAYLVVKDKQFRPDDEPLEAMLYVNSEYGHSSSSLGMRIINVTGDWERGDPPAVVFPLGNVAPGSSRILRFDTRVHLANITFGTPSFVSDVQVSKSDPLYNFTFKPNSDFTADQTLTIQIELMPDSQLSLISPAFDSTTVLGTMQESNRIGSWVFAGRGDANTEITIGARKRSKASE